MIYPDFIQVSSKEVEEFRGKFWNPPLGLIEAHENLKRAKYFEWMERVNKMLLEYERKSENSNV